MITYVSSTADTKTKGEKPAAETKAASSAKAPSTAPFVAVTEPKPAKESKWPKGRKIGKSAANKA